MKNVSVVASTKSGLDVRGGHDRARLGVDQAHRGVGRPRHERRLDLVAAELGRIDRQRLDQVGRRRRRAPPVPSSAAPTVAGRSRHGGDELGERGASRIGLVVEPERVRLVAVRRAVDRDRDDRRAGIGDHVVALVRDVGQQAELVGVGQQLLHGRRRDRALLDVGQQRAREDRRHRPGREGPAVAGHEGDRRVGEARPRRARSRPRW